MQRLLKRLCTVLVAGGMVSGVFATPAFAAQTHPQKQAHPQNLTADEIVGKAITDLKDASSVHTSARISILGLTVAESGTFTRHGCQTAVSMSAPGHSISEVFLVVGTSAWVRPDAGALKSLGYTGAELSSLEGKWITFAAVKKVAGANSFPAPAAVCGARSEFGKLAPHGWTLGKLAKVNGQWAWQVSGTSTETVSGCIQMGTKCKNYSTKVSRKVSAYVSDSAKPEFLSMSADGATERFSGFNAKVTLTAPPAADVLTSIPKPTGKSST
jgi:hypothetical protein